MSDNTINLTNQVPIHSISTRSPALWGILTRNFDQNTCQKVNDFFLQADSLGANQEIYIRPSDVSFNPRSARVIQIALEHCLNKNLNLVVACLEVCCKKFTKIKLDNNEICLAKNCKNLDILRHIHLSKLAANEIFKVIKTSQKDLSKLDSNSYKILIDKINSALIRIEKSLCHGNLS